MIGGIKHDSAELVRDALGHEFSNPEERLEASGPAGAPFSFANAVRELWKYIELYHDGNAVSVGFITGNRRWRLDTL